MQLTLGSERPLSAVLLWLGLVEDRRGEILDRGLPRRNCEHDDRSMQGNLLDSSPASSASVRLMDGDEVVAVRHRATVIVYRLLQAHGPRSDAEQILLATTSACTAVG
ncbi:hypothetical protein [Microbacterium sp. SORGH_AS_0421]|uniref:hypothetical protein n=1 Tax=Microbacterium sp. SORGH_AS_0421 TaxID=3041768 RepID=UPI002791702F|nr:hypothetical protein [Microbacterium sp. SORGH_AS_0421]MDQ1176980.1 hypothetical protein [Microbacterium sp. SORGH_AS_0421]